MWELLLKFYLGQNEDYSPGNNTPESSERLLQGGKGKVSIYVILMKGAYIQSMLILQKIFC